MCPWEQQPWPHRSCCFSVVGGACLAYSILTSLSCVFPEPLASHCRCTRDATEGHLDKYLPALFTRAVDPKQPQREQACDLLGLVQGSFSRETVLAAAERTVERHRVPKAKARAVEFGNEIVQAAALGSVDNGTGTVIVALMQPENTVVFLSLRHSPCFSANASAFKTITPQGPLCTCFGAHSHKNSSVSWLLA